jgi:deazaflavin-dependent oxidoreductase (nitroreductase family)
MYLYLTTTGRITGQPREIEIWFTEHGGRFYLIAERESANWVLNIRSQPQVKVRVGDTEFNTFARVVHNDREPQLAATVKALFVAKYGWSDGGTLVRVSVTSRWTADLKNRGTVDRT